MPRDWEIIREILIRLEESEVSNNAVNANDFIGMPEQYVAYNMKLLNEHGFIVANIRESKTLDRGIKAALARRLTFSGHELLDVIRDKSVWQKIQDKIKLKGVDLTFDLVLTVGKQIIGSLLS